MRSWAPLLFASLAGCGSVEYGTIEYGTYAAGSYAYGASPYVAPEQAYGVSPPSAEARLEIEVFLRELAPYGEWIEDPTYGRVFVPNDPDYRPFRNGQWVEEGEELAWLSYDAIGWAVCHYGSWTVLEDGRWAWIPGEEWAPARVDWRETDEYVGWAPRMVSGYPDPTMWMFVQSTYLLIDHVYTYAIDPGYAQSVYAGGRPMSGFPSRRWRADRGVRAARGGAVAVRPHRGPPGRGVGTAHGGGVAVRPPASAARDGSVAVRPPAYAARDGSVITRGPARAPLVEGPRDTVVLGRSLPRETVIYDAGRGRRAVPPSVSVSPAVTSAPPRAVPVPPPAMSARPAPMPAVAPQYGPRLPQRVPAPAVQGPAIDRGPARYSRVAPPQSAPVYRAPSPSYTRMAPPQSAPVYRAPSPSYTRTAPPPSARSYGGPSPSYSAPRASPSYSAPRAAPSYGGSSSPTPRAAPSRSVTPSAGAGFGGSRFVRPR